MSKLWGGRFNSETNSSLVELNCSLPIDSRLFSEDIDGSLAYAKALNLAGYLTIEELDSIFNGLEIIRQEWLNNAIQFKDTDEDVHTVNERRLIEICGDSGEKLHTGRSRNDQVITDVKLWIKKAIQKCIRLFIDVIEAMVNIAEKHLDVIMPGYTHLQRAQPVLFSHWLLSHAFALREDYTRFRDLLSRVNVLPLGSGAISGNPLGIDRSFLAESLGFSGLTLNSMHAVGDRDFIVEFNFNASLNCLHLSRLAEDLILYSSKEFGFVTISDAFSTGSSLMPQKRNPDSLELVRGISGNVFGQMSGFMMTLKGLPSTYNKDLQFDKQSLFNSFDQMTKSLDIISGVVETVQVNAENCVKALSTDMLATDWAYYLVKKGIPFRTAHHLVGKVVALAETRKLDLCAIPVSDLKLISSKFDEDIVSVYNFRNSIEQYSVVGGTSTSSVKQQMQILRKLITDIKQKQ